jgi:alpha-glucosidase
VKQSVAASLEGLPTGGGVPAWTLNSHDVHRAVTRYGIVRPEPVTSPDPNTVRVRPRGEVDLRLGSARARAMLLLVLALPGSVYLYQGEELGLPEVQDLDDDARRDPIWTRSAGTEHGRDGCRVPLPWTAAGNSLGFSPPVSEHPWLPQPDWFADYAVDRQTGAVGSTLEFYRSALAVRRSFIGADDLVWLDTGRADVLAFTRGALHAVTVFSDEPFDVPAAWGSAAISSAEAAGRRLPGTSAAWFCPA